MARQIERLCGAVSLHHDLLGEAVRERPTMAYEIFLVRAVVGGLAAGLLVDHVRNGGTVEIPSLGITLGKADLE